MTSFRLGKSLENREKKLLYSAVSSVGTKGINIIVSILSLPLIYKSIGAERYGMMLSITSIAVVVNFADLGLGFGLQNKIPKLMLSKDNSLHRAISSTFFFLLISAIIVFLAFYLISNNIEWHKILNLKSQLAVDEVDVSVRLFGFLFCLSVPFSVVQKIQIGLQKGYNVNIWIAAGNLFSLIAIYLLYNTKASTPSIIAVIYGSNAVFIITNFVHYFFFERKDLLPKFSLVSFELVKTVVSDSFIFFLVQILGLFLFASNSALLVHYVGPEKVAEFNIAYKLAIFFLLPLESSAPYITPALNEAIVNGDNSWVKRSIRRGIITACLTALISGVAIFYFGDYIVELWIGKSAILSNKVLISLAFFLILYANLGCVLSYIMLSSTFIKIKAVIYTTAVTLSIVIKVFAIKHFDVEGAFWSTTIPMFLLYIIPCLWVLKRKNVL